MKAETAPVTRKLALILVGVAALSMVAFLVLTAYAPELRRNQSGSADAISKSAIGFAGLRFMAEKTGREGWTSSTPLRPEDADLLVLMPDFGSSPGIVRTLSDGGVTLIVLPKWATVSDPAKIGWVRKVSHAGRLVQTPLTAIAKDATVKHAEKPGPVRLIAKSRHLAPLLPSANITIDSLQTIAGKMLVADIVDAKGDAVLAHVKDTQTYILADPDFINNQAVDDARLARFAVGLLADLSDGGVVAFDLTLNGFGKTNSMLRAIFAPPFLGATLCALLAAGFIAFHAFFRFGGARRAGRVFAFGKRALADNTAAFIHLMHREPAMATRYAQAMVRSVAAHKGIAPERQAETGWIGALEKHASSAVTLEELRLEAEQVRDTSGLMRVAKKIYSWRRGLLQ